MVFCLAYCLTWRPCMLTAEFRTIFIPDCPSAVWDQRLNTLSVRKQVLPVFCDSLACEQQSPQQAALSFRKVQFWYRWYSNTSIQFRLNAIFLTSPKWHCTAGHRRPRGWGAPCIWSGKPILLYTFSFISGGDLYLQSHSFRCIFHPAGCRR